MPRWQQDPVHNRFRECARHPRSPALYATAQRTHRSPRALPHRAQARNVAATPFPFPYAQGVALLLIVFLISMPVLMSAWLDGAGAVVVGPRVFRSRVCLVLHALVLKT